MDVHGHVGSPDTEAPLFALSAWWGAVPGEVEAQAAEAAGRVLDSARKEDPNPPPGLYADPRTRGRLAAALVARLPDLARALDGAGEPVAERFARFLEGCGPRGREVAASVREDPAAVTVGRALRWTAHVLWWDGVREEAARDLERRVRFAPAVLPAHVDLLAGSPAGRTLDVADGRRVRVLDPTGREVCGLTVPGVAVVDAALLAALGGEAAVLGSVDFLRVFSGLVGRAAGRKAEDPDRTDAGIFDVDGGFEGLTELCGTCNEARTRDAFLVGARVVVPGGEWVGLWTGHLARGSRWTGGNVLAVSLNPGLWPGRAGGGRLTPILTHDREPALPRDPALRAPALRFVLLTLRDFADRWAELRRDGTIPTSAARLSAHASAVGAPGRLSRILGPLLAGSDDRPPLLVQPERNRLDLTPDYADVRAFLLEGAALSDRQRRRARAGVRRREGEATRPWKPGRRGSG